MSYTEHLTRYTTHFIDQLAVSGVKHAVISPGSRSTPLAVTMAEYDGIRHWVQLDERSAGFFAVGLAKEKQEPVALICTSGTAAANYFPAVIEAYYSRVPLIVLTADRPHELRDVGAPQAIDQIHMYGDYAKWFHDMLIPEENRELYARKQAARSVEEALRGHAGPVQVNFPFREPLMPDFTLEGLWRGDTVFPEPKRGVRMLQEAELTDYATRFSGEEKGLIVCGPQTDPHAAEWIAKLGEKLGAPVFADPLSQMRAGSFSKTNVITHYDSLFRSERFGDWLEDVDYVIRFGAMPVSKAYLKWVQRTEDTDMYVVDSDVSSREPAGVSTEFIWADPLSFCKDLLPLVESGSDTFLENMKELDSEAAEVMLEKGKDELYEGEAVHEVSGLLDPGSLLFVGNSMPIRDVDTFFPAVDKDISIFANRGANGIDGVTSTAAGLAAGGRRVTLLTGDVSFFHDMNGLHAVKRYGLDLTIVLFNNNGGGIFSYLPQASHPEHYETLFGTPLDMDLSHAVHMYKGTHRKVGTRQEFVQAFQEASQEKGLSVVEAFVSRETHVAYHRNKWTLLDEKVRDKVGNDESHSE
ncbi:2-succinyl-5-enolpyruvyl-6-hydroxy-3-cyclohexene-1-carboxylic-acid synthase [Salimicrobium halophilum]|uniref:2-succinyl-5-enolpyruvyl-6-hydroxy-3-cyclohexene-1-carboxylate synthase n=1 Tax=Salimicrobium halophilum TaxID=86666 RepID=A0A1G8VBD7_9BACI|nr:2-succinyl-5-enolpyruvyl-6-hydroxy-3-cyclohexene-1-carboxylic-acid synthase [Salimicrobium halophilum]SDJ63391.1 2-succinyl-5-enolpyruvyl-6-hydroxy-3-cyclohexene-1-carboxylate synthase [Salimicrobium halophilum]